jgi:hypothetical protein
VQALPTMPRYGVSTVDAPLQERVKSRKKLNRSYLRVIQIAIQLAKRWPGNLDCNPDC